MEQNSIYRWVTGGFKRQAYLGRNIFKKGFDLFWALKFFFGNSECWVPGLIAKICQYIGIEIREADVYEFGQQEIVQDNQIQT